jgi:glutamyl-tRNA synthetase
VILYEAFGWDLPRFRHMPLLRNKDRSKISKRKNPTSLLWYKENGYLPEALVNFLGLMGYSSADGEEMFSRDQMLADFDTKRMSTTGPVFDLEKLAWLNGEYIRADTADKLTRRLIDHWAYRAATDHEPDPETDGPLYAWIRANGGFESESVEQFVLATMPLIQPRLKTLEEYAVVTRCFFLDDVSGYAPEELVPKKRDLAGTQDILRTARTELDAMEHWTTAGLEQTLRGLVDVTGWKAREIFQAVRVAVTGSKVSPPLFESLELIGRHDSLARIDQALAL